MSRANSKRSAEKEKSRFDFSVEEGTATIADLIEEINREYIPERGEVATFRSLNRTLEFIEGITGACITYESMCDTALLKVVKLLFMNGEKRDKPQGNQGAKKKHLLGLIRRPMSVDEATMEFCTGTTIARDQEGAALIRHLLGELAKEIDPEKILRLEQVISRPDTWVTKLSVAPVQETQSEAETLQDHIGEGTEDIAFLIDRLFQEDSRRAAVVFREIVREMNRYHFIHEARYEVRAHEALYIHLRTLGIQHFLLHHEKYIKDIRVVDPISPIGGQLGEFRERMSKESVLPGATARDTVRFADCKQFMQLHSADMRALVEMATSLSTDDKEYERNVPRAARILRWAVYRQHNHTLPGDAPLHVQELVAALCSVRYQQKVKTKYSAYWPGQSSQGKSPERMLDKSIKEVMNLHQGVFLLYYNRYREFLAAFEGSSERHDAFVNFELSRFEQYKLAMRSKSIMEFLSSTQFLDSFCHRLALEVVYENLG